MVARFDFYRGLGGIKFSEGDRFRFGKALAAFGDVSGIAAWNPDGRRCVGGHSHAQVLLAFTSFQRLAMRL